MLRRWSRSSPAAEPAIPKCWGPWSRRLACPKATCNATTTLKATCQGRKTDVQDCQWLQQLHTYGLLSGAFRPDGEIRRLRSYLRQRVMLVQYASHHIQHMQKALTQMNVKLHHVISDITGKTGMDIIEAIMSGQRTRDNWRNCATPGSRPTRRRSPSRCKATGGKSTSSS